MLFLRDKIKLGETRNFLYLNKKIRRKSRIQKRFYRISIYNNIKFEFFYAKKFLSKTIFNYLKPNIQNNLKIKEEKIFKHYGNEIDGKFFTVDNKVKVGFSIITSKSQYTLSTIDGEERIESLPIGGNDFISEEVLLVDNKLINKTKMDLDLNNKLSLKQNYIQNSQENINYFVKTININDKQIGQFYTRDLLNKDDIRKGYWEKSLSKSGNLIYKELDKKIDKIDID